MLDAINNATFQFQLLGSFLVYVMTKLVLKSRSKLKIDEVKQLYELEYASENETIKFSKYLTVVIE